ncbi:universal stress protein [Gemelliphila palaticanis]|uniref:Universal stress protein n=1 Tax=Gemelliphila palaticanis TaxID=81950 RepID=A0ABX2SWU5_9BACL|nr:universal stress protein [Gemella palaticanis]MBF0714710.1 universal stress protein [Gemella palaticanis]NYS46640.1 universal stress protein [Gemella palaticanis]
MENKYSRILVAVDGSKQAEWAFKNAVAIAKRNENSTLYVASIIDATIATSGLSDPYIFNSFFKKTKKLVESYVEVAKNEGLDNVHGIVEQGIPKIVLSEDIVDEKDIDLIVCGSSGLTGFKRMLMGSVSEGIVRYAKCDVIIIKQKSLPEDFEAEIAAKFQEEE